MHPFIRMLRAFNRFLDAVKFILIGITITPIGLLLAGMAAGGGHGSYMPAKLFFPFGMILPCLSGQSITPACLVLAVMQFPFYGVILTCLNRTPLRQRIAMVVIALSHLITFVLCLAGNRF